MLHTVLRLSQHLLSIHFFQRESTPIFLQILHFNHVVVFAAVTIAIVIVITTIAAVQRVQVLVVFVVRQVVVKGVVERAGRVLVRDGAVLAPRRVPQSIVVAVTSPPPAAATAATAVKNQTREQQRNANFRGWAVDATRRATAEGCCGMLEACCRRVCQRLAFLVVPTTKE